MNNYFSVFYQKYVLPLKKYQNLDLSLRVDRKFISPSAFFLTM